MVVRRSRSRGRARGREARVSGLEDKGLNIQHSSIVSGRGIATGAIAPESNKSLNFFLAKVVLESGLPTS